MNPAAKLIAADPMLLIALLRVSAVSLKIPVEFKPPATVSRYNTNASLPENGIPPGFERLKVTVVPSSIILRIAFP
ncbi:MAG: hypothetical protein NZM04_00160, partial [Methylacidiphilales bacterium]|nr:hypothetical protein [Candidatus Methylacidiphilales bacterium]